MAAFVVEPIQGKACVSSPGYLLGAQKLCRKYGAIFIDDEGSGPENGPHRKVPGHRARWASRLIRTSVLSKTLSGGFVPVAAVLCKKWIHDKVFSSMQRSVVHSSTFSQGNLRHGGWTRSPRRARPLSS